MATEVLSGNNAALSTESPFTMTPEMLRSTVLALEHLSNDVPSELRANDRLRKRLLLAVQKLTAEVESPEETNQRLIYSPLELMGAKIGVDLDVFNQLAQTNGPLTSEDVGHTAGADKTMVLRLLKYMASMGMVKEVGSDLWAASNLGNNLAMRGNAAGVNFMFDANIKAFLALPAWLRSRRYAMPTEAADSPFANGHEMPPAETFYDWIARNPDVGREFNTFMGAHRVGTQTWLDGIDLESILDGAKASDASIESKRPAFVDIGGGLGHQCEALKSAYPGTTGRIVLQDLAEVIEIASPSSGIEKMQHNFFEEQPVRGALIYYFRSVLRNWPDNECILALSHVRDALSDDSIIVVDEIVVPDVQATKEATQLDLVMLAVLNAHARTESQWRDLFQAASLQLTSVQCYEETGRECVLVARKIIEFEPSRQQSEARL